MSEQQPPPNVEDTAAVAGPIEAPGAAESTPQDTDWQKRYSDLQPEYTRTTQRVSELENREQWFNVLVTAEDADTRRQAAEALGYELPEEEEPEPVEYDDPYEHLDQRLTAQEQRQEQAEQQAREAQEGALIQAISNERMEALGITDEQDQNLVLAYAINALQPVHEPGMPVPLPDVKAAVEFLQGRDTRQMKNWAKTKNAPYVSPGGRPANEVPNLETHEGRMEHAARRLMEMEQPQ